MVEVARYARQSHCRMRLVSLLIFSTFIRVAQAKSNILFITYKQVYWTHPVESFSGVGACSIYAKIYFCSQFTSAVMHAILRRRTSRLPVDLNDRIIIQDINRAFLQGIYCSGPRTSKAFGGHPEARPNFISR